MIFYERRGVNMGISGALLKQEKEGPKVYKMKASGKAATDAEYEKFESVQRTTPSPLFFFSRSPFVEIA